MLPTTVVALLVAAATQHSQVCYQHYSLAQTESTIRAVYASGPTPTPLRHLRYMEDCQQQPSDYHTAVAYQYQVAHPPATPRTVSTPSSSSWSGGYAIPTSIVMCESGGNWRAVNPSGAGGAYQIMPSTWAANGGTGLPQDASPAEQSAIAARIWAGGAGASNWVCAGG